MGKTMIAVCAITRIRSAATTTLLVVGLLSIRLTMGVRSLTDFAPAGPMLTGRVGADAAVLDDGRVLLVGGDGSTGSAELFDPATDTFSATGPMTSGREGAAVARLDNGRVVVVGGRDG